MDGKVEASSGFAPANAAAGLGAGATVSSAAVEAAAGFTRCNEVLAEEAKGLSQFGQQAESSGVAAKGDGFGGEFRADPGDIGIAADGKLQALPIPGLDPDAAGRHAGRTGKIMVSVELLQAERRETKASDRPEGDAVMSLEMKVGMDRIEGRGRGPVKGPAVGVIHAGGAAHGRCAYQRAFAGVKIEADVGGLEGSLIVDRPGVA